jgi:mannose-1-phosphate guanylyltransferase
MRALLLAAGFGTRLKPITDTKPKCLVEVNNQTMLGHWVNKLDIPEINQIVINTHYMSKLVLTEIVQMPQSYKILPFFESQLLGTAGTLLATITEEDESLLVIHCDNYSSIEILSLINFHQINQSLVTIGIFRTSDSSSTGMVGLSSAGFVDEFIEKPSKTTLTWGNAAVYLFSKQALLEIKSKHKYSRDIAADILPTFIGRMHAFPIYGYHIDIGTPNRLKKARELFTNE